MWLQDRAPSFVEGYIGAVSLLHDASFPGRVHFICHVVRDIYRRLPSALDIPSHPRPGEVFPGMVTTLVNEWTKYPPPEEVGHPSGDTCRSVSHQVFRRLEKIVQKKREMLKQPTVGQQLAIALFRSQDRRDDDFIPRWVTERFDAEYDYFVKRAHLALSIDKAPNDDGLLTHFEAFERSFHSLVGLYFSGKEDLDAILQDTNAVTD